MLSRARWEGWLEIIDHPVGLGILPVMTSARQRAALRGLAQVLIFFSTTNALRAREQDWARVFAHIQRIAQEKDLGGVRQLELVFEWVKAEYKVSIFPCFLASF